MTVINSLIIPVTADPANLGKKLKAAEGVVGKFAGNINSTLAGIGSALSVGAIAGFTKAMIDDAGRIQDTADALGVAAEHLQAMEFSGRLAGVGAEELSAALGKLQENIGKAAAGEKEMDAAFKRLGLSGGELIKLRLDQQVGKLADALAAVDDPATKAMMAADVLGKGWRKLMPMLKEGSAGLGEAAQELARLNAILSGEQVKALDDLGDQWEKLTTQVKAFGKQALASVGPDLTAGLKKAGEELQKGWPQKIAKALMGVVDPAEFARTWRDGPAALVKGVDAATASMDALQKASEAGPSAALFHAAEAARKLAEETKKAADTFAAENDPLAKMFQGIKKLEEQREKFGGLLDPALFGNAHRKLAESVIGLGDLRTEAEKLEDQLGLIQEAFGQGLLGTGTQALEREAHAVEQALDQLKKPEKREANDLKLLEANVAGSKGAAEAIIRHQFAGAERREKVDERTAKATEAAEKLLESIRDEIRQQRVAAEGGGEIDF